MLLKRKLPIQQNLPIDMNIDWTKPIQTTGGGKARLLERLTQVGDGASDTFAVVITRKGMDDPEACFQDVFEYTENGIALRYDTAAPKLQNVPEPPKDVVLFFNVYKGRERNCNGYGYLSLGDAIDGRALGGADGVFKITFGVNDRDGSLYFKSALALPPN